MSEPRCWLDEDGEHFWWWQECDAELDAWRLEVGFKREHMLPLGPDGWTLVQKDPLTIAPSILCGICKTHGFWRDGKWVKA